MNKKPFSAMDKPDYEGWVDILRALACFAVVVIHTCASHLKHFSVPVQNDWLFYNLLTALSRFCIPVFFMLSGYLLLKRTESTRAFLRHRLLTILIPVFFWSLVYSLQSCREQHLTVTPQNVFSLLLSGPAYYHLWFLYTLAGLYCLIPVFRVFVTHAGNRLLLYAVALWFLLACLLPFCRLLFYKLSGESLRWQPLFVLAGPSGYLLAGYFFGRLRVSNRVFLFCLGGYLFIAAATAWGTLHLSLLKDGYADFLYRPLAASVVLLSFLFFVSVKHWASSLTPESVWLKTAQVISPLTLGIYLIHPLLIAYLFKGNSVADFAFISFPLLKIALKTALVFGFSLLCVWLMSKVPILKRTISFSRPPSQSIKDFGG